MACLDPQIKALALTTHIAISLSFKSVDCSKCFAPLMHSNTKFLSKTYASGRNNYASGFFLNDDQKSVLVFFFGIDM
jgi:hypothetical protein